MTEYRDAATALPLSLEPVAPSPAVRARLLAGVSSRAPRSAPVFTRVFWAAAALLLFAVILRSISSDTRELALHGTPEVPEARGMLRCSERSVDFRLAGLPELPKGKCYQLWHIGGDGIPVAQATFHLDPSGVLHGSDALKQGAHPDHLFAFTMEPEGGSRQPTRPIYAVARY